MTRIAQEGAGGALPPKSEAEAMQRYAVERGIGEGVEVLLDAESLNTVENAVEVRKLLDARGGAVTNLLVVTSEFHLPRVQRTFELIFEGSEFSLSFMGSSDEDLTEAERERESAVEPAMIARLPPQARIYRRYYEGTLTLAEARRRFFHRDEPHSDVW